MSAEIVDLGLQRWLRGETYRVEERAGRFLIVGYSKSGEEVGTFSHPMFDTKRAASGFLTRWAKSVGVKVRR